jgi:hypothetical protein
MNHGYQRRLGWLAGLLHASLLAAQVPSPVAPADGTASSASAPAVLTRVADIRSLSPERAAQRQPVRITGVITYHFADWNELFVQDETPSPPYKRGTVSKFSGPVIPATSHPLYRRGKCADWKPANCHRRDR